MPQYDQNHVKLNDGTVVRDGITRPDLIDEKDPSKGYKYSLKVVFPPNSPDVQLLEQLSQRCLQESAFRGVLPAGGFMPVGTVQPNEMNGQFTGYKIVNFKTYYMPDIYDENGAVLDNMRLAACLYPGQKVDVLTSCKDYNNVSKGIRAQLAAFAVHTNSNAPKVQVSNGGIDTSKAFGNSIYPADNPAQGVQYQQPSTGGMPPPFTAPNPHNNTMMVPPPPEQYYIGPDGNKYSESQMRSAGYQDAQLAMLQKA